MNDVLYMSPEKAELVNHSYRRIVWDMMMRGEVKGWVAFFEMIQDGTSRKLIAENARYPG